MLYGGSGDEILAYSYARRGYFLFHVEVLTRSSIVLRCVFNLPKKSNNGINC